VNPESSNIQRSLLLDSGFALRAPRNDLILSISGLREAASSAGGLCIFAQVPHMALARSCR
jgi:hypothetical protein